jgi:hypothetical protein
VPRLIESPVRIPASGEPQKTIDEFVGRASDGAEYVSICMPAFSFDIVHRDPD